MNGNHNITGDFITLIYHVNDHVIDNKIVYSVRNYRFPVHAHSLRPTVLNVLNELTVRNLQFWGLSSEFALKTLVLLFSLSIAQIRGSIIIWNPSSSDESKSIEKV